MRQIARPATGCLSYVIGDPATGVCAVVDPPRDASAVLAEVQALGLRIGLVAETHTHADHLSGAHALAQATGAPLHLPFLSPAQFAHVPIADGGVMRVGDLRVRAVHTPGHTADAMSFLVNDRAIVGDTLLVGSPGRSDFYERGPEDMYHSIFDKLLKLDDEVVLYPAHFGPHHGLPERLMITVGEERRVAEALSLRSKDAFVRYMTEDWPPKPEGWQEIVQANLRG